MVRLEKSEVLQRVIRKDDLGDLGVSTLTKTLEAIDKGKLSEAKELAKYLHRESKDVHDVYGDWISAALTYVAQKHGEEEIFDFIKVTLGPLMAGLPQLYQVLDREAFIQYLAEYCRAHRTGPKQLGDVVIKDEGDRYVIVQDPCGSGGRLRRGDPVAGTPPRTEPPYNYRTIKGAYPWTWGRKNVFVYCAHCAVMEILSIESVGFPVSIVEYQDDPGKPCKALIYKDPKKIPEEYYTRLGKTKPVDI